MKRALSLLAVLGALALGCEGGASGRCAAIASKIEQMPEFKEQGMAQYANQFRTAFGEACGKLPEDQLKCVESKSSAREIMEGCPAASDAIRQAGQKAMEAR